MAVYNKIGFFCVSIVAFQILKSLRRIILLVFSKQLHIIRPDLTVQGRWAGGTDGIGRAFVEALASRGLNIIILGFIDDKLHDVAREVSLTYNVQTKIYAADFSQCRNIYSYLEKHLAGYEIGILVNAIGLSYQYPEYFIDIPFTDKNYRKYFSNAVFNHIINTNIYPVIHICRIVLKGMCKRKRGIIINVSSTTAEISSPMLAVYAASKAYISKFTDDLNIEYRNHGVIIQCLQPGFVTRNSVPILSWLRPRPDQYVEAAIRTVGLMDKTCGFLPHSLLLILFRFMEMLSVEQTRTMMRRLMERLRERAPARQNGGLTSECLF